MGESQREPSRNDPPIPYPAAVRLTEASWNHSARLEVIGKLLVYYFSVYMPLHSEEVAQELKKHMLPLL